ncbi:hypothetical protein [Marinobacter sp. W-8]|uniref:hypothetical protein n=1 Tax=Marinobacter sp. W-8 TaxID=3369658 RepID=UPI0037C63F9B
MQKLSNHLTDCRSRLLDADALLNYLRKPENLNHMLESDSPEVTLAAMIERTFDLVSDACGKTELLCKQYEAEPRSLPTQSDAQATHESMEDAGAEHFNNIDMIHEHTRSMLLMMLVYLEQARDGGSELSGLIVETYVGQLIDNMDRAGQEMRALAEVGR